MKLAYTLAALSALAFVSAANADPRLSDCVQMAKQVSVALESAPPSANTDAAREQANVGRTYCASQMYSQGVARYAKALQLLGKS